MEINDEKTIPNCDIDDGNLSHFVGYRDGLANGSRADNRIDYLSRIG
jgi:hypothetical protein